MVPGGMLIHSRRADRSTPKSSNPTCVPRLEPRVTQRSHLSVACSRVCLRVIFPNVANEGLMQPEHLRANYYIFCGSVEGMPRWVFEWSTVRL